MIQLRGCIVPRASSGTSRKGTGSHPRWRNNTAPTRALGRCSAAEISVGADADGGGAEDDIVCGRGGEVSEPRKVAGVPPMLKREGSRSRLLRYGAPSHRPSKVSQKSKRSSGDVCARASAAASAFALYVPSSDGPPAAWTSADAARDASVSRA